MARKLTQKQTDKLIDKAVTMTYSRHAQGKTIGVMKIGDVFKDARAALIAVAPTVLSRNGVPYSIEGMTEAQIVDTLDKAMPEIVARYCDK